MEVDFVALMKAVANQWLSEFMHAVWIWGNVTGVLYIHITLHYACTEWHKQSLLTEQMTAETELTEDWSKIRDQTFLMWGQQGRKNSLSAGSTVESVWISVPDL